jgi:hypothetical protein
MRGSLLTEKLRVLVRIVKHELSRAELTIEYGHIVVRARGLFISFCLMTLLVTCAATKIDNTQQPRPPELREGVQHSPARTSRSR